MVMSWALPLLYLASDFRMTARRLWLLAMRIGNHQPHNHYTIPDVDQGLISEGINQFLLPLVKWNYVGEKSVERLRKWKVSRGKRKRWESEQYISVALSCSVISRVVASSRRLEVERRCNREQAKDA